MKVLRIKIVLLLLFIKKKFAWFDLAKLLIGAFIVLLINGLFILIISIGYTKQTGQSIAFVYQLLSIPIMPLLWIFCGLCAISLCNVIGTYTKTDLDGLMMVTSKTIISLDMPTKFYFDTVFRVKTHIHTGTDKISFYSDTMYSYYGILCRLGEFELMKELLYAIYNNSDTVKSIDLAVKGLYIPFECMIYVNTNMLQLIKNVKKLLQIKRSSL